MLRGQSRKRRIGGTHPALVSLLEQRQPADVGVREEQAVVTSGKTLAGRGAEKADRGPNHAVAKPEDVESRHALVNIRMRPAQISEHTGRERVPGLLDAIAVRRARHSLS